MIEKLRKEIDGIDDKIIELLQKRKYLFKEVASIKKDQDKPIIDEEREKEIIDRLKEKAKESGLDEKFITSLYDLILENSRNEQEK